MPHMKKYLTQKDIPTLKDGGRRLVISDIHGCAKTLKALIEKINLTKNDQLFFLGDYIDRGPDSSGVLDYIIQLIEEKYNIFPLRGNHEESLLEAFRDYDRETFILMLKKITKTPDLLDENLTLRKRHIDFLEALPYYVELDNCFLVHGGFDSRKPDPFKDYSAMIQLYIDDDIYDTSILKGKKLIHGHKPNELQRIQNKIKENAQVIPLDNGCVYVKKHKIYDSTKTGNLCCLDIDTNELFLQKNIDLIFIS